MIKPILESEFKIRVLDNPLAQDLKIYAYLTDEGYKIQFTKGRTDSEKSEIRNLVNTRGITKIFKSLDTVYKNIVEKYGCPVIIEPTFHLD